MPGLLWGFRRASRGKKFGNEVADSIGIRRSHFHTSLEAGGVPMHMIMLAGLKDEGTSIAECREMLLPVLLDGLRAIEFRFGPQSSLTESIETVEQWLSEVSTVEADSLSGDEPIVNSDNDPSIVTEVATNNEFLEDVGGAGEDLLGTAIKAFHHLWVQRSIDKSTIDAFVSSLESHPAYKSLLIDEQQLKARGSEFRQSLAHLLTALNYLFMVSPVFPLEPDHVELEAKKKQCKHAGLRTLEYLASSMQRGDPINMESGNEDLASASVNGAHEGDLGRRRDGEAEKANIFFEEEKARAAGIGLRIGKRFVEYWQNRGVESGLLTEFIDIINENNVTKSILMDIMVLQGAQGLDEDQVTLVIQAVYDLIFMTWSGFPFEYDANVVNNKLKICQDAGLSTLDQYANLIHPDGLDDK